MGLPTKTLHAQLNRKTYQAIVQCAYTRNDMSHAEVEGELYDNNGIENGTLGLLPPTLVARHILDNIDHGSCHNLSTVEMAIMQML